MKKNKSLKKDKKQRIPFGVLTKKGLAGLAMAGVMIASPLMIAGCSDGKDGKDGTPGTIWKSGTDYTVFTDAKVGDYFIDTDDYILYQKGENDWTVVMQNYGKPGTTPQAPSAPVITIVDDYWCIDGVSTGVKAKGEDGQPGGTPKVEIKDGFWYINDVKSVKAEAEDGHTPVITINQDGYWVVDGTPTQTKATPSTITIVGGYWYIDGEPTGVKAEGKDGATWLTGDKITGTGTGIPATIPNSKIGDLYLNTNTCDIYQCMEENTWDWIANIKGNPGDPGEPGDPGKPGEDGISTYLGYDGYIWNGTERTEFSVNANLGENVVENTIGIEGTMSKYFAGSYIDLSTNTIALMANYMPTIKATQYSGTTVLQIKVVAEQTGLLYIGTAKVAEIVDARIKGTSCNPNTKPYEVQTGLNIIPVELSVGEDETVVFGGNGSVGLYVAQGITTNDEHGNYTLVDNQPHTEVISETSDIQDTLAIQVSAKGGALYEEKSIFPTLKNDCVTFGNAKLGAGSDGGSPYIYKNLELFENKKITKIGVPVISVANVSGASLEVYKLNVADIVDNGVDLNNYTNSKYTLNITAEQIGGNKNVNKWIYLDCDIEVGEGETLAFVSDTTNFSWGYDTTEATSQTNPYAFVCRILESNKTAGDFYKELNFKLMFDVVYEDCVGDKLFEENLSDLKEKEEKMATEQSKIYELSEKIANKNLSILGDSISTYAGYSNNTDSNTSLSDYPAFYGNPEKGSSVTLNDTWWKQVVDITGMNLLVNNSKSGDTVASAKTSRAVNLHDNNGENSGENPEIIAVYIGVNDIKGNASLTKETFKANYSTMISNMKGAYQGSRVFVFTIPQYTYSTDRTSITDEELEVYNAAIREIADEQGCVVVDLFKNSGITKANHTEYTQEGLHPNEAGMDLIAECFWNVLYETYVTNAND